jgi:hypothetical protein
LDEGNYPGSRTAEVLEPLEQKSPAGVWWWRELPHMSVRRERAAGCVLSDGRFAAVFAGEDGENVNTASCEVLNLDGGERWEPLPPMREARSDFLLCGGGRVRRRRRRTWFVINRGGVRGRAAAVEAASLQPSPRRHLDLDRKRADVNAVYGVFVAEVLLARRYEEEGEECQWKVHRFSLVDIWGFFSGVSFFRDIFVTE